MYSSTKAMSSLESGSSVNKMLSTRLAMPIFCVLIYILLQEDTFATTFNLFSSPISGNGNNYISQYSSNSKKRLGNELGIKITEKDLNSSVAFANNIVNNMKRLEVNLGWSDIKVKTGTPSHGMFISFAPEREAVVRGRDALVAMKASLQLLNSFCNKHNINHHDCARYLNTFKFTSTPLRPSCSRLMKRCSQEEYLSPYRSMDGSCNHISNGIKGESFTGFSRLLYPDYLDGVHEPRRATNKKPLPSPRLLVTSLVDHTDNLNDRLTLSVMQWGQFVEHDLGRVASAIMIHTENPIECCTTRGTNLSPRYIHPFCSPVSIPTDDKHYAKQGLDCMSYVRSIPAVRSDCSFGPSDQLNQATHFLDGSQIYGSTYRKSTTLRSFVDGKLETSSLNDKDYLPVSQNPAEDCQLASTETKCYKSGDSRVNFQPQLTAMHTIWFREHNRIAEALARLNPQWDDETLFQETRRVVIAEIQHITYNEWIKAMLSPRYRGAIDNFSLYDEDVDPSVSNSFATAAMRALKSLYDGDIKLYDENRKARSSLSLQKYFNNPYMIHEGGVLDSLIRGLATQRSQRVDRHYAEDLINQLYNNGRFGFDVLSMDIQRGRDHGLPAYIRFRSLCGLQDAQQFSDFNDSMSQENIAMLSKIYSSPQDVDLIVGGILEHSDTDSLLGPTFSCLVSDQLTRTKNGDRYFYTNEDQPKPFSTSQLNEIRKVTLARIFCDNGDNITMMQANVFEVVGPRNNLVNCYGKKIPRLNFAPWAENRERYFS